MGLFEEFSQLFRKRREENEAGIEFTPDLYERNAFAGTSVDLAGDLDSHQYSHLRHYPLPNEDDLAAIPELKGYWGLYRFEQTCILLWHETRKVTIGYTPWESEERSFTRTLSIEEPYVQRLLLGLQALSRRRFEPLLDPKPGERALLFQNVLLGAPFFLVDSYLEGSRISTIWNANYLKSQADARVAQFRLYYSCCKYFRKLSGWAK